MAISTKKGGTGEGEQKRRRNEKKKRHGALIVTEARVQTAQNGVCKTYATARFGENRTGGKEGPGNQSCLEKGKRGAWREPEDVGRGKKAAEDL